MEVVLALGTFKNTSILWEYSRAGLNFLVLAYKWWLLKTNFIVILCFSVGANRTIFQLAWGVLDQDSTGSKCLLKAED